MCRRADCRRVEREKRFVDGRAQLAVLLLTAHAMRRDVDNARKSLCRAADDIERLLTGTAREALQSIAQGEDVGPCRIRKGDELQELCRRINAAVDALRARSTAVQANAAQALAGREVPAALPTSGSGQPQRLA